MRRLTKSIAAMTFTALAIGSPAIVSAQSATGTPATGTAAAAPTNPDDVIRCRSIEVTGSLARRERVCKTVGEWRRLADRGNENARDIVDFSRSRPSGQ